VAHLGVAHLNVAHLSAPHCHFSLLIFGYLRFPHCIFTHMKLKGKVVYISVEGGAYGIMDDSGHKFLPINMPNQLKKDGASVVCKVRPADVETTIMWGEPVYIESFETLD
jgi:hypothetical protein